MTATGYQKHDPGDGIALAYERKTGAAPTFVWLSGFRSDMTGTKAEALSQWAENKEQSFLRLDYSGHGASDGAFVDGTIGRWQEDARAVIEHAAPGPLVLIGSSMGAWIALLLQRTMPARVKGLILIAPAPDFVVRLMWPSLPEAVQRQIMEQGRWDMPSAYDPEPTPITRALVEDGRRNLVLDAPIPFTGPVRILHGTDDRDVPIAHGRLVFDTLQSPDKRFLVVEGGDHRLSNEQDITLLLDTADEVRTALAENSQK